MRKNPLVQIINRWIAIFFSIVTLGYGLAAFLGLQLQHSLFVQFQPTHTYMSYETALGFIMASLGLLFLNFHQFHLTRIMAILLTFVAGMALWRDFFSSYWHLPELLWSGQLPHSIGTVPMTACAFLLIALVFWWNATEKKVTRRTIIYTSALGMIVLSVGFLCLFGYIFYTASNFVGDVALFTPMSTNTAIGFILFGIAINNSATYLAYRNNVNRHKALPSMVATFIAIMSLLFWRFIIIQELGSIPPNLVMITIIKELSMAGILGLAVYFIQRSYYLAKDAKRMVALTRATLEASANGMLVEDGNGKIVGHNKKLIEMWQVPKELQQEVQLDKIIGWSAGLLNSKKDFLQVVSMLRANPGTTHVGELHLKNGQTFEFFAFPEELNGKIIGRVFSFHDITIRKQTEVDLLYKATHDLLTGLVNRALLMDHMQQAISVAKRQEGRVAVLFFDIDRFKIINDTLGHSVGDLLLKAIAERLKDHSREEDTLARLGGDEFVLLAVGLENEEAIIPVVERLIEVFEQPFEIENYKLNLNCSIGISVFPKDGDNPNQLLKSADTAMYKAKKNQQHFQFYTVQIQQQFAQLLSVENQLRRAIENNELILYYQPIIDLHSRKITALEALVRWNHPQRGVIDAMDFITTVEESGLITTLDTWVLRAACQQAQIWQKNAVFFGDISVNISERKFRQPQFFPSLQQLLVELAFDPRHLILELSERVLAKEGDLSEVCRNLKKLGIKLAIDDFGTGYSSLNLLKCLPLATLKIDGSFTSDLTENSGDKVIVLTIIKMAKSLNLRVLAEGVETQEQLNFLRVSGCDEVQGYYFSEPLDAEQFEKLSASLSQKTFDALL